MRLVALIEAADHVCYRYRLKAFAGELDRRGISLEPLVIAKGLRARIAQFGALGDADAVVLSRKLLPVWQVALLRRRARRLIYDFDDAMYLRDSNRNKDPESWLRTLRFWAMVYAADSVIAGNRVLGERAAGYAEPDAVHVVPTCIATNTYALARHERTADEARLVWIGQAGTLSGVARAAPLVTALQLARLELRIISDRLPDMPGVRLTGRPWSEATESMQLADADIGISWLPAGPWSEGKCGLKVLQYMAAGLPVVANRVGMHNELVADGQTGFLADTRDEWQSALARLANDPELRRQMGARARARLERGFSIDAWSEYVGDLFEREMSPADTSAFERLGPPDLVATRSGGA